MIRKPAMKMRRADELARRLLIVASPIGNPNGGISAWWSGDYIPVIFLNA
jgi:hypothetical protein